MGADVGGRDGRQAGAVRAQLRGECDACGRRDGGEIADHQPGFAAAEADEGEMPVGVVARRVLVAIGEVPGAAFGESRTLRQGEQFAVARQDGRLGLRQRGAAVQRAVEQAQLGRVAPVEDGGAAVGAVDAVFAHFLAEIEHEGRRVEQQRAGERGEGAAGVAQELRRGEPLLVVVLQEIQHPGLHVAQPLPVPGDAAGRGAAAADGPQGVVEPGLVVEQVEAHVFEVAAVVVLAVDLRHEEQVRKIGLYGRNERLQGFRGNQLHHVATEAVYAP